MTVYDCCLYIDEIGALTQRLATLEDLIDVFVVVEVLGKDASGRVRESDLRRQWSALKPWARKLRHVVVTPAAPARTTAKLKQWVRQQVPNPLLGLEHIGRGMADLERGDTVVLSNVWDIPSPSWLSQQVGGTSAKSAQFVVADAAAPDEAAGNVRVGGVAVTVDATNLTRPSRILKQALKGRAGTPGAEFVGIRVGEQQRRRGPGDGADSDRDPRPMIICAYLHDEDEAIVREAFGLDEERGSRLPFFLWQDTNMIGPERAFEHCWSQFPDRDVIIVHPDMAPMPGDTTNSWYDDLIAYRDQLPDAGIIGCDLIFPKPTTTGGVAAQCVGGRIRNGKIKHVGGRDHEYDERYAGVRRSDWATFGGVLIRREAIDMVGSFDDRYQWAYVMDVDYCMEVQLRGLRTYQVPVNIIHDENGTTKEFLKNPEYMKKVDENNILFADKWAAVFRGKSRVGEDPADLGVLRRFPGG